MQDTIIKGTGNSRTLASVPNFMTLYPSYEAFARSLISGELPIDIGPLNPAGLTRRGTDLNKPNLLSDETAALYPGLPSDPVLNDVLALIANSFEVINTSLTGKTVIEAGSYTGAGTTSKEIPLEIDADAIILLSQEATYVSQLCVAFRGNNSIYYSNRNASTPVHTVAWKDTSVLFNSNGYCVMDQQNIRYFYLAIGRKYDNS